MKQLIHNGVIVPKFYEAKEFHIHCKGKKIKLTPKQEEMAYAWVKKLGTVYVKDKVFLKNFFKDFSIVLGIEGNVNAEHFDFSEIQSYIEKEKERKLALTKEEKKQLAQARKAVREANKEKFGYALVDGVKMEISNYMVEPSSIFMGRGKHPLRGRWKEGAGKEDVILNLSPDASIPNGNWKEVVWALEDMWIAKWNDKLTGKTKYVWLADSSSIKQEKEIEKFDKARKLERKINKIRRHVENNLNSNNEKRRKIATVCYLIDKFKLRVGDEKDKDEANTVGATTLLPRHVSFDRNGLVRFKFIGKDYVKWYKEEILPEPVIENLRTFTSDNKSPIFNGVRSEDVNSFLGELMPELTAKVFRTYHASKVVKEYLKKSKITKFDADYEKKHEAKIANLQAAIACNHKRKIPKRWKESLEKKRERIKILKEKVKLKKTDKSKVRAREALKKARLRLKLMKVTKDYNLGTSLKSYIDPHIYYSWGKKVNFDWKLYYPKTLQKKFSWVDK